MTYFFCYDITNTGRRNLISKTLEQFGLRIQKSFFYCDIPPVMMEKIKATLLDIINEKEDRLFVYPVCDDCLIKTRVIGNEVQLQTESYEIL